MGEDPEPDYVFNGTPVNERYWDFLRTAEIESGDEVRVKTRSTEWKSRMRVLSYTGDRLVFKSAHGKEYVIATYNRPHPLEPTKPMVRDEGGKRSKGVLTRLEVFKT